MKLLRTKIKRVKYWNHIGDYDYSYSVREPLYTVRLNQKEYELLSNLLNTMEKKNI